MVLLIACLSLSGCQGVRFKDSKEIFDAAYKIENMENMEFTFSKDSTLTVRQEGIYELGENEAGERVVKICLDDIDRELPEDYNFTEYLLKEEKDHIVLTYTTEEFDLDANPMTLYFLKGENGLMAGKYFAGAYQIGTGGDSYQYIFREDGGITMQVKEHYYADKGEMTLSDHEGSTKYQYEFSEDMFILKNRKGETVLTLQKKVGTE